MTTPEPLNLSFFPPCLVPSLGNQLRDEIAIACPLAKFLPQPLERRESTLQNETFVLDPRVQPLALL